jgi:hypothetical protein
MGAGDARNFLYCENNMYRKQVRDQHTRIDQFGVTGLEQEETDRIPIYAQGAVTRLESGKGGRVRRPVAIHAEAMTLRWVLSTLHMTMYPDDSSMSQGFL